ncbi:UNVERIFIED_CONTAM: hypothetical protein FKN15_003106 [Acipenser sinensis]
MIEIYSDNENFHVLIDQSKIMQYKHRIDDLKTITRVQIEIYSDNENFHVLIDQSKIMQYKHRIDDLKTITRVQHHTPARAGTKCQPVHHHAATTQHALERGCRASKECLADKEAQVTASSKCISHTEFQFRNLRAGFQRLSSNSCKLKVQMQY